MAGTSRAGDKQGESTRVDSNGHLNRVCLEKGLAHRESR